MFNLVWDKSSFELQAVVLDTFSSAFCQTGCFFLLCVGETLIPKGMHRPWNSFGVFAKQIQKRMSITS